MKAGSLLLVLVLGAVPGPTAAQSTERLYQEACDVGDWIACNVFGLMLETGEWIAQDLARAATLYRRVCEQGEPVGCLNLGRMHEAGAGVTRDLALATGLYRTACEGGDQVGCMLREGVGQAELTLTAARHSKYGRVADAETRAVLAGALVELPDLDVRAISNAQGRFVLEGLAAGLYRLRAERAGYEPVEGQLVVPGNMEFFVLLTPAEGADPEAPGQIVGQVVEGAGRALANVDISVLGQERARTFSNQQGRFTIRDVPPGLVMLRFSRLGYTPRTATVVVQPETTVEVGATMAIEPIVFEAIEVSVRSRNLEQSGFYQRAEGGWGTHFRPSDLAELQPVVLSDALRGRVPGVTVEQDVIGGTARMVSRRSFSVAGGECSLPVFIDGMPAGAEDIDLFPADVIEAVEVYQGIETPIQYSLDACGAVLIWTRRAN